MSAFGRAAFRHALVACGVVLAIALGAGLVRLLPWILSPDVPLRVAVPFAKALAAAALETALLIGLPIGFALAAARSVDRGELRALAALGVSPLVWALGSLRHLLALSVIGLAAAALWNADASMPGRFARQLVQQAEASCGRAQEPRTALVPMVGVTWLCFPGKSPRVTGPLPGFGDRAWFTARTLAPSDDLRSFELSDLRIVTRKTENAPALHLHVGSARVSGLAPWGRPAKLSALERALLIAVCAALLALCAAWLVARRSTSHRAVALAFGAVPALSALAMLHSLDKGPLPNAAYALVALAGLAALAAAAVAELAIGRLVAGDGR